MSGHDRAPERPKLATEVLSLAKSGLVEKGWRKRTGHIYTLDVGTPSAIGWLGLNRSVGHDGSWMAINPVLGVRHQEVERTLAEILGERFHPYNPPTIRTNIGYVMPEGTLVQWGFDRGEDYTRKVSDFLRAVDEFGRPFVAANSGLREILDKMLDPEGRFGIPFYLPLRIPVAYFLLGEVEQAKAYLGEQLRLLGHNQVDEDEYRRFADCLTRRLQDA